MSSTPRIAPALEPAAPTEHRVVAAEGDHPRGTKSTNSLVDVVPVVPGDLVVLAVGVVVAALGAAELVAAEQHRDALGQQQRGQEVASLAVAQRQDRPGRRSVPRRRGSTSGCATRRRGCPRRWPRCACRCSDTRSAQGEAVVGGDEVDRRRRAAGVGLVEVGAAGEAEPNSAERRRLAAPEVADRVAVAGRSTPTTAAGSCRPGSRPRRRPTARRSA